MRLALRALALLMFVTLIAACGSDDSQRLVGIGASLHGMPGLGASVYAQGLPNAAAMAIDSQGRLWVATAAYDDSGTDAVYLVDAVGSTPRKVIADAHTPLGLLWIDDALYVAGSGGVDAYSGFDGTTFEDHHSVVALPQGVGEVNGMALSSSGRLSLGVSAPCDSCTPTSQYSAAVLSFLPDGSDLRVDTSGIRAPVGLAYFPDTDTLYVTMNQRDDLGDATPGDWLSIVHRGQNWDFPGCYGQGGDVCAGAPSPVAELDPHAAVSDVAIVTGQLGTGIGTAAIVAEWATGLVLAVPLASDGSGATSAPKTLLTGVKNPVAVLVAPDGALLVGDWATGVIYRISPSSQPALTAP